jgi:mono/diheme cytochrome c family protein
MKLKVITGIVLLLVVLIVSCQNDKGPDFNRYYSAGKLVYQNHCQNCHGENGEGLQALMPPLTDSVFLKKNIHILPCLVKNGFQGKITVSKRNFDWQMPPANLNYIEIAQALTYITNSFGNNLGTVTFEDVSAAMGKCK